MTIAATHILEDLAHQFAMPPFDFNEDGVVALDMENRGTLYIELQQEDWLVYMVSWHKPVEAHSILHLLEGCHPQHHSSMSLTMGYVGEDGRVILARMAQVEADISTLLRIIETLLRLQGRD